MNFEALAKQIGTIQQALQGQVAHAVNLALTARNWLIGYYIVEFEQNGEDRAAYGEQLLKKLESKLRTKGLTERRFREFRRLYQVYPQLQSSVIQYLKANTEIRRLATAEFTEPIRRLVTAKSSDDINRCPVVSYSCSESWMMPADRLFSRLSSTHLTTISEIDNPVKRAFYEMETIRGCWSVKELERQIHSLYYERSGLSQNKEALSALVTESDLEQSILDNLQNFLMEMGHGFCFEARQKRILIDGDYYFADLVFYHRILKCHIIVELKIDRFRHEYASQLNMYLNYYKSEVMQPNDNPPVGILLCTEKGDTLVKYATAGLDRNIFVQKYMVELPTEDEMKKFISREINW